MGVKQCKTDIAQQWARGSAGQDWGGYGESNGGALALTYWFQGAGQVRGRRLWQWVMCYIYWKTFIITHPGQVASCSVTLFTAIAVPSFYVSERAKSRWWKTRSGHRWLIFLFYIPDEASSSDSVMGIAKLDVSFSLTGNSNPFPGIHIFIRIWDMT